MNKKHTKRRVKRKAQSIYGTGYSFLTFFPGDKSTKKQREQIRKKVIHLLINKLCNGEKLIDKVTYNVTFDES